MTIIYNFLLYHDFMKKYLVKNIFHKNIGQLHANWRAAS